MRKEFKFCVPANFHGLFCPFEKAVGQKVQRQSERSLRLCLHCRWKLEQFGLQGSEPVDLSWLLSNHGQQGFVLQPVLSAPVARPQGSSQLERTKNMISQSAAQTSVPRGGAWVCEGCFAAIAPHLSTSPHDQCTPNKVWCEAGQVCQALFPAVNRSFA